MVLIDLLEPIWTNENGLRVLTRVSARAPETALPPVVCVHGLSVSSRYMVPIARHLAAQRRVYIPDLPGFGKSERPAHTLDIWELTDALVRRMDAFEIEAAALLGNSMGCQIMADLAVRYPQRVTQLIMVGPTMDRRARTIHEQAWRLARTALHEPLSSILLQSYDYWKCGLRRTIGTLQYALADRIEHKLPRIAAPTLLVRGADDIVCPQRWIEELHALTPHSTLAVLPDAPHAANYSAPAQLAQVVLPFLAHHAPTDTATRAAG